MKQKFIKISLMMIVLLVLASCVKEDLTQNQQHMKDLCTKKFGKSAWMKMNEMSNGQITGPVCRGCMINLQEHVCNIEKLKQTINETERNISVEIELSPKEPKLNQPTNIFFKFKDPSQNPVKDFTVSHEKLIHAIIINDDFSIFSHLHPEDDSITTNVMKENGLFGLNYEFTKTGKYLLSLNFNINNEQFSKQFVVNAGENNNEVNTDFSTTKKFDEYEVEFSRPELLKSGEEYLLSYFFKKAGNAIINLQPYLAAPMHVVTVKSDLTKAMHTHGILDKANDITGHAIHENRAELPEKFGPKINVNVVFPEKGIYNIFSEINHEGKILVASFMVNVE